MCGHAASNVVRPEASTAAAVDTAVINSHTWQLDTCAATLCADADSDVMTE